MQREVLRYKRKKSGCCPGHDDYPDETYASRRSKRARTKGKRQEHKYVRTLQRQALNQVLQVDESA